MPKLIECWFRIHRTPDGEISLQVIESDKGGKWVVTVGGATAIATLSAFDDHFDSLEAAQREADDWVVRISHHDCRTAKCGDWKVERRVRSDQSRVIH